MARVLPENLIKNPHERIERIIRTSSDKYIDYPMPLSSNYSSCSKLIFHPESLTRMAWDIFVLIVIIYQALTIPYFVCFNDDYTDLLNIIEIVLTFIFFFDILLNFNTGFYIKGNLVTNRKLIILDYLKLWFWIDIIATFPYSWLIEGFQTESSSSHKSSKILNALRVFRFLRILKLIRIAKLKRILIKIEDYIASNTIANIFVFIRLLAMVFFIAHWTACLWFFIGYQESLSHPITWVINARVKDSSSYEQYITSLYWAFTTIATVGYGDITPITLNEKLFAMLTMIMSSGVFAYTVGSIGSLVSKQNANENTYREQVVAVNSYMKKKMLNKDLQLRVRRYLDYIWEMKKKTKLDDKQVLNLLSEPLRDEIHSLINANHIKQCRGFSVYEDYFIAQLTRTLENETYAPYDTIFEEGDLSSKLYFVLSGKIKIFDSNTNTVFTELSAKQYFGEIAFFTGSSRCASARCSEFVDLLSLVRLNLLCLLDKFPEMLELTKILQKKCEDGNYTAIGVSCYICEEPGHIASKCKNFIINLDQEECIQKWMNFKDKKIKVNPEKSMPNFQRKLRKVNRNGYSQRNVVGRPQGLEKSLEFFPVIGERQNNSGASTNKDTL